MLALACWARLHYWHCNCISPGRRWGSSRAGTKAPCLMSWLMNKTLKTWLILAPSKPTLVKNKTLECYWNLISSIEVDLSQVSSTLRENPNGTQRKEEDALPASFTSHSWLLTGVKRCLSRRAHTSSVTFITHHSNSSLNTQDRNKQYESMHFVQSCSSLSPVTTFAHLLSLCSSHTQVNKCLPLFF